MEVAGEAMVCRVARALSVVDTGLMVSANRNLSKYAELGFMVIEDSPGESGPLAGIAAGLRTMSTAWLLAAPCDLPLLTERYGKSMLSHPGDRRGDRPEVRQLARVAKAAGRLHFACLLVHRAGLPHLTSYLKNGGRKMEDWLTSVGYDAVDFGPDDTAFLNVNTTQHLAGAESELAKR